MLPLPPSNTYQAQLITAINQSAQSLSDLVFQKNFTEQGACMLQIWRCYY